MLDAPDDDEEVGALHGDVGERAPGRVELALVCCTERFKVCLDSNRLVVGAREEVRKPENKYEAGATLLASERPFGQVHLLWQIFGIEEKDERRSEDEHSEEGDEEDSGDEEEEVRIIFALYYGLSDIELQMEKKARQLQRRAEELREAADLIDMQLPFRNKIWINSLVNHNLGGDVSQFLADVRHVEKTGRKRDPTWARKGDREGQRRSRNTMGYQPLGSAANTASGSGQNSTIMVDSD